MNGEATSTTSIKVQGEYNVLVFHFTFNGFYETKPKILPWQELNNDETLLFYTIESDCLQQQPQHPTAMDKIRDLEAPKVKVLSESETDYGIPTFTQHMNNLEVAEKGTAVFECRVEPCKDPSMKIGNII